MSAEEFYNFMFSTMGAAYSPWTSLTYEQQEQFRTTFDEWKIGEIANIESAIEDRGIKKASAVVSNARMKTLRATPLVVVPAVANKIIFPIAVYASTPEVTTSRTGASDIQLRWQLTSTSLQSATGNFARIVTVGSVSGDRSTVIYPTTFSPLSLLSVFVNKPLVLHNVDASEYASGSADNILTVNISYYLADV